MYDENQLLAEILNQVKIKKFPEEYVELTRDMEVLELPAGDEISLYRELEGIYLLVDQHRIFFNNPILAKFCYYAAKNGSKTIAVPPPDKAKKAVKRYLEDLSNIKGLIDEKVDALHLTGGETENIKEKMYMSLGLYGIIEPV
ncbi:MAG TPA: hypothetical protein VKU79_01600 [Thermoplasmataceae archaeon]|nr:hypothetical protein [Thermoplasmatales archaeon AK]HLH85543.1 hypothetical protein [Thermoplasmataceae archaeon]